MKVSRLIFLAIIGGIIYQNKFMVEKHLQLLKSLQPMIMTYLELESFTGGLTAYARENKGRLPENIGDWLNQNYKSNSKSDMSHDFFGSPYRVMLDRDTMTDYLLSCGPDGECFTKDDMELRISFKPQQ